MEGDSPPPSFFLRRTIESHVGYDHIAAHCKAMPEERPSRAAMQQPLYK